MERVEVISEDKARLWYASLRLWIWKYHTISLEHRALLFKQNTENLATYHWLWVLGFEEGRCQDFSKTPWTWLEIRRMVECRILKLSPITGEPVRNVLAVIPTKSS